MTVEKDKKRDNARNILIVVILVFILALTAGLIALLTNGNEESVSDDVGASMDTTHDVQASNTSDSDSQSEETSLNEENDLAIEAAGENEGNTTDEGPSDGTLDDVNVNDDASNDQNQEDTDIVAPDETQSSSNDDASEQNDPVLVADNDNIDLVADADGLVDDSEVDEDANANQGDEDADNDNDNDFMNDPLPDDLEVIDPIANTDYQLSVWYDKLTEISVNHDMSYDVSLKIEGATFKENEIMLFETYEAMMSEFIVFNRTGEAIHYNNFSLEISPTIMRIHIDFDEVFNITRDELLTITIDPGFLVNGDLYDIQSVEVTMEDCGSGTQNDPWTLSGHLDLFMMTQDPDGYFAFVQDIDGNELDSIDLDFDGQAFTGQLDGNNFDLYYHYAHQPLFETIEGGVVKDLRFKDFYVGDSGNPDFKSLLAEKVYGATISNVDAYGGQVFGEKYAAGLIGQAYDNTVISDCNLEHIDIEGTYRVGGIIGYGKNTVIENCTVSGDMAGGEKMGGICGDIAVSDNGGNVSIMDCAFSGSIYGIRQLGGIVGKTTGAAVIQSCEASVDITAVENRVGGIAGSIYGIINIQDCVTSGSLKATEYIGGVAGGVTEDVSFGTITGCRNQIDTFEFVSNSNTLSKVHRIVGDGGERVTLDNFSGIVTVTNNAGADLSDQLLTFDQYGPDGQLLLQIQPIVLPGEIVLP